MKIERHHHIKVYVYDDAMMYVNIFKIFYNYKNVKNSNVFIKNIKN